MRAEQLAYIAIAPLGISFMTAQYADMLSRIDVFSIAAAVVSVAAGAVMHAALNPILDLTEQMQPQERGPYWTAFLALMAMWLPV